MRRVLRHKSDTPVPYQPIHDHNNGSEIGTPVEIESRTAELSITMEDAPLDQVMQRQTSRKFIRSAM